MLNTTTPKGLMKKYSWLLIPFSIAMLICFLAFTLNNMSIFGSKVTFYWDGHDQMLPFLQALKHNTLQGRDMGFSMQSIFGMDNIALIAYYTSSPINLIAFVFPDKYLTEAYTVLVLLRMGLASGAFAYFAHYHLKIDKHISIILAIAYGLISWATSYSIFFMWLDGYVWLPIICCCIDRLFDDKSPTLLIISFFMLFLSNYYTGFMVAVYSVFYFLTKAALVISEENYKFLLKKFIIFGISGITAFLLVGFLILPATAMMYTGMGSDKFGNALPSLNYVFEVFSLLSVFPSTLSGGLVNIGLTSNLRNPGMIKLYQSVLGMILMLGFIINKNIPKRKRIVWSALLLVLFLSIQNNWIYLYLWHLGNNPSTLSFRNSFVISFTILIMAAFMFQDLSNGSEEGVKAVKKSSIGLILLLLIYNGIALSPDGNQPAISLQIYSVNLIIMVGWFALLQLYNRFRSTKTIKIIIILMVLLMSSETLFNAWRTFKIYDPHYRSEYSQRQADISDIMDEINKSGRDGYRVGDINQMTPNDGMLYNYPSGVHHSSTENLAAIEFMNEAGFAMKTWKYRTYYNQNVITDSIFGFKFVFPSDDKNTDYAMHKTEAGNTYQENPNNLPIMFASKGNFDDLIFYDDKGSINLSNSTLNNKLLNENEDILKAEKLEPKLIKRDTLKRIAPYVQSEMAKNIFDDNNIYHTLEPQTTSFENNTMTFKTTTDGPVYLFAPNYKSFIVNIEGKEEEISIKESENKYLGSYKANTIVEVRSKIEDEAKALEDMSIRKVTLTQVNYENLSKAAAKIKNKTLDFKRVNDTTFTAKVIAETDDNLFITIPYTNGMKLYVNGQEQQIEKAMNVFMGAKLNEGENDIKLVYTRPGQKTGILVSLVALAGFGSYIVFNFYKKRKNKSLNK